MNKWKILVTATNYSKYCKAGKQILLDAGCEVIENPYQRPMVFGELKEIVGDVDAVVAGVDTWDRHVFAIAPKLKGIVRFGVGVDNFNISDAETFGIKMCNCPGINTNAVAEQTVGLMLSATRGIPGLNAEIRTGSWKRVMYHELGNSTIGLLGFGAIARSVAEKISGFHPRLLAYDKFPNMDEAKRLNVTLCSFDDLIKKSDIISIHVPALPETWHMIGAEQLEKMKDGVILVNTARGSIVDEAAAMEAMNTGKLAMWASDVFEKEPITPEQPMFAYEQYIATPHTSSETYENYEQTSIVTARMVLDILEGREPQHRVV